MVGGGRGREKKLGKRVVRAQPILPNNSPAKSPPKPQRYGHRSSCVCIQLFKRSSLQFADALQQDVHSRCVCALRVSSLRGAAVHSWYGALGCHASLLGHSTHSTNRCSQARPCPCLGPRPRRRARHLHPWRRRPRPSPSPPCTPRPSNHQHQPMRGRPGGRRTRTHSPPTRRLARRPLHKGAPAGMDRLLSARQTCGLSSSAVSLPSSRPRTRTRLLPPSQRTNQRRAPRPGTCSILAERA
jgi:hypothetical protein